MWGRRAVSDFTQEHLVFAWIGRAQVQYTGSGGQPADEGEAMVRQLQVRGAVVFADLVVGYGIGWCCVWCA